MDSYTNSLVDHICNRRFFQKASLVAFTSLLSRSAFSYTGKMSNFVHLDSGRFRTW